MIKLYNRCWQLKYDATIMLIIVLLTNCSADKKIPNKRQRFVDELWYLPCFLLPLSVERYGYITLLVYIIHKITLFFPQEINVHVTENYHTLMQRKNISNLFNALSKIQFTFTIFTKTTLFIPQNFVNRLFLISSGYYSRRRKRRRQWLHGLWENVK